MGLFDSNGPANGPAETELAEQLKIHPFLYIIEKILSDEDNKWISKRTDYYDHGQISVYISKNYFCISAKMRELNFYRNGQGDCRLQLDDVEEPVVCSTTLTDFGYEPLHYYAASNGKTVKEDRVVYLWALTVQNFMREKLPDAEFHILGAAGNNGIKVFTYTLPQLEMLDWLKLK